MKRLIVALAFAAVAGGGLLWYRAQQEREAEIARVEARLLQFDDREVTAIDLALEGDDGRFEKAPDGTWWRVEPTRDLADASLLMELLTLSRRSSVVRSIERHDALSEYGLDPAKIDLRLEGVDAPRLRIGDRVPTGEGVFAHVDGRPGVLIVEAVTGGPLTHPDPLEFRDRYLPGLPRAAITGVVFESDGAEVALALQNDGWWVVEPRRLPAADLEVTRILDRIDRAEVVRYVDGADPKDGELGLGDGAIRVTLKSDTEERRLVIGEETAAGYRYVTRDDRPAILVATFESLNDVPRSPEEILDTRVTKVNRYRVDAFTYERGGDVLALKRIDDVWMTQEEGRPVDAEAAVLFVQKLTEAPLRGYEARLPGGDPVATFTFETEDGVSGRLELFAAGKVVRESLPDVTLLTGREPPRIPEDL